MGTGEGIDGGGERLVGFVTCEDAIHRLYAYMDGELTEQRRVEIVQHLDLCGPCVGAYGFEVELRRVVASRCKDRVPDSLVDRVAAALAAEHAPTADS